MEIAFDFGITNTDVAVQYKQELTFYTFSSKKVELAFILEILSEINLDIKLITKIAVTGGKSSDLQDALDGIPIIAAILPGFALPALCILSDLIFTSFRPISKLKAFTTVNALYSPKLWPATPSVLCPFSSKIFPMIVLTIKIEG